MSVTTTSTGAVKGTESQSGRFDTGFIAHSRTVQTYQEHKDFQRPCRHELRTSSANLCHISHGQESRSYEKDRQDQDVADEHAPSSNTSSNTAAPCQTGGHQLGSRSYTGPSFITPAPALSNDAGSRLQEADSIVDRSC